MNVLYDIESTAGRGFTNPLDTYKICSVKSIRTRRHYWAIAVAVGSTGSNWGGIARLPLRRNIEDGVIESLKNAIGPDARELNWYIAK